MVLSSKPSHVDKAEQPLITRLRSCFLVIMGIRRNVMLTWVTRFSGIQPLPYDRMVKGDFMGYDRCGNAFAANLDNPRQTMSSHVADRIPVLPGCYQGDLDLPQH